MILATTQFGDPVRSIEGLRATAPVDCQERVTKGSGYHVDLFEPVASHLGHKIYHSYFLGRYVKTQEPLLRLRDGAQERGAGFQELGQKSEQRLVTTMLLQCLTKASSKEAGGDDRGGG